MRRKKTIKQEVQKRIDDYLKNDDKYEIVGVELKNLRLSSDQTLECASGNTCSTSYLSKLENNKIKGNGFILRELCTRQNLSDEQIETLFESKNIIDEALEAFLLDDIEKVKTFTDNKDFKNYRIDIISLIYNLMNNDINKCAKLIDSLSLLMSSMLEFDFLIFALMSGFYYLKVGRFNDAFETVKDLDFFSLPKNVMILRHVLLFRASYGLNSFDAFFHYKNLEEIYVKEFLINQLEYDRYLMSLFFLRNKSFYAYEELIKGIRCQKYILSLRLIEAFIKGDINLIYDLGKFELTDYARMLYLYTYDRDEYKKKLNEFDYNYVILDFNIILLDYLRCEKIEEKAGFIEEIAIPYLQISSNKYLEAFFIIEASKCKVAKGFKGVKYMIEKLKLQNYFINFEDGDIFEASQNNN